MARELFRPEGIARLRRTDFNHWELAPQPYLQDDGSPIQRILLVSAGVEH